MIDGLIIWLALVGVATIAMFAFDLLVWLCRQFRKLFLDVGRSPSTDAADPESDFRLYEDHAK